MNVVVALKRQSLRLSKECAKLGPGNENFLPSRKSLKLSGFFASEDAKPGVLSGASSAAAKEKVTEGGIIFTEIHSSRLALRGWDGLFVKPMVQRHMVFILGNMIGGIGLLLIGMNMMTDGLKLASGNALRDILGRWTRTRVRGLLSGFLITGVVQASGAVTVATIGFANAGVLTLERATWIIYGSNVGTTLTTWIVALIGFKLDIEAFALPLIGLGALLKFTGAYSRRGSLGFALIGFGVLFLGIDILKDTFESLGSSYELPEAASPGVKDYALYVLIGMILTTLMQSSTAAMVLTLSAAAGALVPLELAGAVVIGTNIGTTSTALIAVVGATATAKRVALSHLAFNLITAIVLLLLLRPALWGISAALPQFGQQATPELVLAAFHTVFNVVGVLLMWPLSDRLARFLNRRFVSAEELSSRPRHLDKTLLSLPYLATDALALEVSRINKYSIIALRNSLRVRDDAHQAVEEHRIVRKLADEVGSYAAQLSRSQLTPFLSETLSNLIESTQQYLLVIDIADDIAELAPVAHEDFDPAISSALEAYIQCISRHLEIQDLSKSEHNVESTTSYDEVELFYRRLKDIILRVAARGEMDMDGMDQLLQYANQAKRGCRQVFKSTQRLIAVRTTLLNSHQQTEALAAEHADDTIVDAAADPPPAIAAAE